MKPYAEVSARAGRQGGADLGALCWLILFIAMAGHAHTVVLSMRAPVAGMIAAGNGVIDVFHRMTGIAQLVPFVGDELVSALQSGEQIGQSLINAGQQQFDSIGGLASGTAALVVLAGILPLLVLWLPVRLRYARAAGDAVVKRDAPGGMDLLALQALTRVPLRLLHPVAEDPAKAWRDGDPETVRKLAALELDRLGLHLQPASRS